MHDRRPPLGRADPNVRADHTVIRRCTHLRDDIQQALDQLAATHDRILPTRAHDSLPARLRELAWILEANHHDGLAWLPNMDPVTEDHRAVAARNYTRLERLRELDEVRMRESDPRQWTTRRPTEDEAA